MAAKQQKKESTEGAAIKLPDRARFGIGSDIQWLLIAPARYEDYSIIQENFANLESMVGDTVLLRGRIKKKLAYAGRTPTSNMYACDRISILLAGPGANINKGSSDEGTIYLSAFGRPGFEWQHTNIGDEIIVRGKVAIFNAAAQISGASLVPKDKLGRVIPIYPAIRQTAGARFAFAVEQNMEWIDAAGALVEADVDWSVPIPGGTLPGVLGFATGKDLLSALHRPSTLSDGMAATDAADILSALSLIRNAAKRRAQKNPNPNSMIPISSRFIQEAIKKLPFKPTGDQKRAIDGIVKELLSPFALDGLLSGDVGSGKTATFLVPLVAAQMSGARCMILTPNLLLIKQLAREIEQYFPGVPVCTVTGEGIKGDPADSANAIIIGTVAIIGAFKRKKLGDSPDFLVIDEQHRFSVEQRTAIAAPYTNVLEATATPIPRTAALAVYGDKSVFLLREIPVVKDIRTAIAYRDDAKEARDFMLEPLKTASDQVAVIYPLVGAEDVDNGLRSIYEAKETWKKFVPENQIAVIHGKMTDDEKEEVIKDFRAGTKRFMIASTVIEVGLTLPDLKRMMIVGSDKMGLVTLHQLRGRLARLGGDGDCLLFVDCLHAEANPETAQRLQILVDHLDGFTVAEKDAEQRGFGDFLSTDGDTQSGKTRTLFLGAKVGPKEIDWVATEFCGVPSEEPNHCL